MLLDPSNPFSPLGCHTNPNRYREKRGSQSDEGSSNTSRGIRVRTRAVARAVCAAHRMHCLLGVSGKPVCVSPGPGHGVVHACRGAVDKLHYYFTGHVSVSGFPLASAVPEVLKLDAPKLCHSEVRRGQPEAPFRCSLLGICVS